MSLLVGRPFVRKIGVGGTPKILSSGNKPVVKVSTFNPDRVLEVEEPFNPEKGLSNLVGKLFGRDTEAAIMAGNAYNAVTRIMTGKK